MRGIRSWTRGRAAAVALAGAALAGCGRGDTALQTDAASVGHGPTPSASPAVVAVAAPEPTSTSAAEGVTEPSFGHLSAADRAALTGIRISYLDPAAERPPVSATKAAGKFRRIPDTTVLSWNVAFGRVTSEYPCRVAGWTPEGGIPRVEQGPCRKEIDHRLAYIVTRRYFGPEPPHSVPPRRHDDPCCVPRVIQRRTIEWLSWGIVDAKTGEFLYGGTS